MNPNPYSQKNLPVVDGASFEKDTVVEADVVIVGTGAGGASAAWEMVKRGLKVIIIEEGPLKTSDDFKMKETEAYPELYQETASRLTNDKAIKIFQGRNVGGGTTINWTSSFRTPKRTLEYWEKEFGIKGFSESELKPVFEEVEKSYNISEWEVPPNENNDILAIGLKKLGLESKIIKRNVKECFNLGYCGMGCPVNAKQSTLIVSIPKVLEKGGKLFFNTKALKLESTNGKVTALLAKGVKKNGKAFSQNITFKAKQFILAAGAVGTPAILLRSHVPNPNGLIGKRTFLHPVTISAAIMKDKVEPFYGAPQSVYSDHFLDSKDFSGPAGYKLEVPPIHPILMASNIFAHGIDHQNIMSKLPYSQVNIALQRDGFHEQSVGGSVELREGYGVGLDYPLTEYMWDGFRDSLLSQAELQFAAGALKVMPMHSEAKLYSNWKETKKNIQNFKMSPTYLKLVSAHVMGGAMFGPNEENSVVDLAGRFHQLENLYVMDGSIFPTSIAANPMESILAIATKLARQLALKLT